MAVRQEDINNSIIGILRKMDVMVESAKITNDSSLVFLNSIDVVMKNDVSVELKKQTGILLSIESKIKSSELGGKTSDNPIKFGMLLGAFSKSLEKIIKAVDKLDPEAGKKIEDFFTRINESLEKIDPEKVKNLPIILGIGSNILKFGFYLSLYSLIAPLAMIGATFFGLTVRLLMVSIGSVDESSIKSLSAISAISKSILIFGASMSLYVIFAVPAMLGATLFGLTVRLLLTSIGTIGDPTEAEKKAKIPLKIGLGVLLFSLSMVAVAAVSPLIVLGTLVVTLAILGISLALYVMGNKKIEEGVKSLLLASLSIVALGVSIFAFNTLVDTESAIITMLTLAGLAITMGLAGALSSSIKKGAIAMSIAGISLIIISLGLFIFKKINFTMDDALVLGATIGGLAIIMGVAGFAATLIALGAGAMILSALAIFAMSYALKEFQTLNWKDKDSDSLSYTIGSVLGALSGTSKNASLSSNIGSAAGRGLQAILSLLSIGPLLLGSAAIWVMSEALEKFKTLEWGDSDSDNLSYVIVSVLNALGPGPEAASTNFGGSILNTILQLMSSGALFFGSAAIWLMSEALLKFKTVGWTETDTGNLGTVISSVLGSLGPGPTTASVNPGGSILNTILQLMSAGNLIFASAAIWLMSEALLKFKSIKWSQEDTKSLSFTISEILDVISGTEKDGGLWGSIKGAAKSFIGAVGSAGNATSLGLAGMSILSLSEALLKWKSVGWGPGQTNNLKSAITSILNILSSEAFAPLDTPLINERMRYFTMFVNNVERLSKTSNEIDKIASNMDKIQNSMKLFKDHVNSFDLKKLTLTDSMMQSLAVLSKNPEAIAGQIDKSIKSAFEELIAAIKELSGVSSESKTEDFAKMESASPTNTTERNTKTSMEMSKMPGSPPISIEDMQNAFMQALTAVTIKTKSESIFG